MEEVVAVTPEEVAGTEPVNRQLGRVSGGRGGKAETRKKSGECRRGLGGARGLPDPSRWPA